MSARDSWLARRREMLPDGPRIQASDVSSILGYGPRTELQVYLEKLGAEVAETADMARGRRWEGPIADEYAEITGRPVRNLGEYEIQQHPTVPWLGATLDRVTQPAPSRAEAVLLSLAEVAAGALAPGAWENAPIIKPAHVPLQIKQAPGKRGDWKAGVPIYVQVQVNIEIACYGASWGAVAAYLGAGPLFTADLARNDTFLEAMLPVLDRFRWRVLHREPPPMDGRPATTDAIMSLFRQNQGQVDIDPDLDVMLRMARAAKREATVAAAKAKQAVLMAMGEAHFGALGDGSFLVRAKRARKAYSVAAGEYEVLTKVRPRLRRRR